MKAIKYFVYLMFLLILAINVYAVSIIQPPTNNNTPSAVYLTISNNPIVINDAININCYAEPPAGVNISHYQVSYIINVQKPSGTNLQYNTNNLNFLNTDEAGVYQVYCSATDNFNQTNTTNTISFTAIIPNRAPVLQSISDQTINENDLFDVAHLISASDSDGDAFTISLTTPLNFTGQWQTNYSSSGNYTINVSVSDGSLMDSKIFNLQVLNINRAPVINTFSPTSTQIINEGSPLTLTINASDPDGDALDYGWYLDGIRMITPQNITYTYSPDYSSSGMHYIIFIASDGNLQTSNYWNINVNDYCGNILNSNNLTVNEGSTISFSPTLYQPCNTNFVYGGGANGWSWENLLKNKPYGINFNTSTGEFSWTPDYNQSGVYEIYLNSTSSSWSNFMITVNDVSTIGNQTKDNSTVEINNSTNLTQDYEGTLTVTLKQANEIVAEFKYNFTESPLNITNLEIENGTSSATKAFIILKGIELQNNNTKTLYMNRLNTNLNYVCVKDADINYISEISSNCQGSNEYLVQCNSVDHSGYTCTKTTDNYVITGLKHSGVIEMDDPVTPSNPSSGGGGGGSSSNQVKAIPEIITPVPPKTPITPSENSNQNQVESNNNEITGAVVGSSPSSLIGILIMLGITILGSTGYVLYNKRRLRW